MKKTERKYDLEDRLVEYAIRIIKLSEKLPNDKTGNHISSQLLRSGTSPAPNYGEAQGAESKKDFVHKLKIALKELRESKVWLKIIIGSGIILPESKLNALLVETDELISIIYKSIETTKKGIK